MRERHSEVLVVLCAAVCEERNHVRRPGSDLQRRYQRSHIRSAMI